MIFLTDALGVILAYMGMLYRSQTLNFCSKLQGNGGTIFENDDQKKPPFSLHDFL